MKLSSFSDKKVALLGAGKDNLSIIPYLLRNNAEITIFEQDDRRELSTPNVRTISGEDYLETIFDYDIIIRSPGIGHWQVEELLSSRDSSRAQPKITTAIDIFLDSAPCPVIGVTGTKGKGTTSVMIGQILKRSGRDVYVLGNIGETVFSVFDKLKTSSVVVAELSSFMLEDITASPTYAVVLAITPDHLQPLSARSPNYHRSFAEYVGSKQNIVRFLPADGIVVYNQDNQPSQSIALSARAKRIAVSSQTKDSDYYLVKEAKAIYHNDRLVAKLDQAGLTGDHILLNALYAVALTDQIGVSREDIEQGLVEFTPLPHRLELVAKKNGVTFVDDSFATAPEATIAALSAFTAPIVLIAGGLGKGADFNELAEAINDSTVCAVVTIGQEADRIAEAIRAVSGRVALERGDSLERAVSKAIELAPIGGVVLLSPACASTDMFVNATERGEQFKKLARLLR